MDIINGAEFDGYKYYEALRDTCAKVKVDPAFGKPKVAEEIDIEWVESPDELPSITDFWKAPDSISNQYVALLSVEPWGFGGIPDGWGPKEAFPNRWSFDQIDTFQKALEKEIGNNRYMYFAQTYMMPPYGGTSAGEAVEGVSSEGGVV